MPKADVVVQDVNPPVAFHRECSHRLRRVLPGDVRRERRCLAPFGADLLSECLPARCVAVDQHDFRALPREQDRGRRAVADALTPGRSPSYDCYLASQTLSHRPILARILWRHTSHLSQQVNQHTNRIDGAGGPQAALQRGAL